MAEKILIVDDENDVRQISVKILEREGYQCTPAADASEARMYLKEQSFDLILCDVIMPGESGINLINFVSKAYPHTASVMVTGVDDPGEVDKALESGVYGYIIKPFDNSQILIGVRNALRRRNLEIDHRRHLEDLEEKIRERTAELRESEEKFRSISDSAQDALIMMDHEGRIDFWNQAAERIFGYGVEEVLGQNLHELLAPGRFLEGHLKGFKEFQGTGKGPAVGKTLELTARRKDGEEFPIELSLSSVNIRGKWHAIGIIRDISERKQTEDDARRAHQELEELISGIASIMIRMSPSGNVSRWNSVAEKAFGIPSADVLGKPLSECGVDWEWERVEKGITVCLEKRRNVRVGDVRFTRTDGKDGFLGITFNAIAHKENALPDVLLMGADITERKNLESQLAQAQKLESIGQLAAGIAHEINTPTQYVGDNTRFLQDAFNDMARVLKGYGRLFEAVKKKAATKGLIQELERAVEETDLGFLTEEIPTAIQQTLEGVERVSKIVLSMKEFSHPGVDEKTAVDINRALESTITVARNEWKYVAEMETDFDPALPPVPCFPGELNQVFLNMIINAAHAIADVMGNGNNGNGKIRISTRNHGDSVEIRFSDTGSGIPENIQHRIFDPFFTTKAVGKGTGQGLAISRSVITEKHGGSLSFETEKGKGTTFIIELPLEGIAA
ncbi:MAG: PAS domain S-box protein [Pseudomonadota bacterium]